MLEKNSFDLLISAEGVLILALMRGCPLSRPPCKLVSAFS